MVNKFLRLNIQYFAADTGAAAGGDAGAAGTAAGDTGTAAAGDTSAAGGGTDTKGATGDTTAGGGDKGTGSKLSEDDLKRYHESEFLKALGVESIDAAKAALAASQQTGDTKQAGDDKKAGDDATGDKKDAADDSKKADDKGETKADDKTGDKKADETPPDTKEADKKEEPTTEQLAKENAGLKAQLAAAKHNVPEESFEDVIAIAERLQQKEDGLTIDAAVKKVIEKYPSFAGVAAPPSDKPRFGTTGSQRQADDRDPFVRTLLGT